MQHVLNFIQSFNYLTEEEITAFSGKLKLMRYKKGDYFIESGQVCTKSCFIEAGGARSFQLLGEKEVTLWFAFDNMPLTAYYSFITQSPTRENIQFLADTSLYAIEFTDLQSLYKKYHGLERVGREIAEYFFVWQEERTLAFQSLSAKDRYQKLLKDEAHLLQLVPLGQIASYLGVTQESLSRIRKSI